MNTRLLEMLRQKYPKGTRVRLIRMDDTVPPGTLGTVYDIDDIGTLHVHWDNGSSLGVIFGVDEVEKV